MEDGNTAALRIYQQQQDRAIEHFDANEKKAIDALVDDMLWQARRNPNERLGKLAVGLIDDALGDVCNATQLIALVEGDEDERAKAKYAVQDAIAANLRNHLIEDEDGQLILADRVREISVEITCARWRASGGAKF